MRKIALLTCISLLSSYSVSASAEPRSIASDSVMQQHKNNAQGIPQPVGPSERLMLNAMPPIKDIRAQNAIVNYSNASKAWWIATKCTVASPEQVQDFKNKLAQFTLMMDMLLASEFGVSVGEANKKYT